MSWSLSVSTNVSVRSFCNAGFSLFPDSLVRYRGECLHYRAEVMQLRGQWNDAARDAQDACELLISRPAAGAAFFV